MESRNPKKRVGTYLLAAFALAVPFSARIAVAQEPGEESRAIPGWLDRIRFSGNVDVTFLDGEERSLAPNGRFALDNARFFLDVDVAGRWSFYLEWDLYRAAELKNQAGSLYLRADKILGKDALNLKVGRFPIPFGEEYLRFHEDRPDNPLISYSGPAPYNWDEGIELFSTGGKLNYVLALQDGDAELNTNTDPQPQVAVKLMWQARPSAYFSLSAVDSGPVGKAALEWGGTHPRPFGASSDVPNYQNGVRVDDDGAGTVSFSAVEGDLVLEPRWGRLWLAYGRVDVASASAASFDRELTWVVAEARLDLGPSYYLAARYSAFGTFDDDQGYLLEAMNGGDDLGYNTRSVRVLSVGGGLRLNKKITLKAEYSSYDFDLVRGVSTEIEAAADRRDYFGLALSGRF